ncbi:hypothetical protein PILCRDRAFT_17204 [Piloderma croceum F 1598]|uniref:Uncharacterized protein n=1 Tax=Piloderma croceum (strain F 1598) TaxID=765440 RepID=A0A0C3EF55_PILCF|nr:hypothetical protein PILCRDRAFT_17204 [Piloderma croceum F 1598]
MASGSSWRAYCTWPTLAVWDPLRDWFSSQDLRIFQPTLRNTGDVKPLVNELRAYDGTYGMHYAPPNIQLTHNRAIHSIARTIDGRDVLICLIAKGGKGLEELDVLQWHVATGHQAFLGYNHCLPMLHLFWKT